MIPSRFDIILVDGMHALWRTSDAYRMLSAQVDGQEMGTGGIYGFLAMCVRLKQKFGGRFIVCWDGVRERNFRRQMYASYKLREEMSPDQEQIRNEMSLQGTVLRDIIATLGVHQYTGNCCEADDVIGRLATELNIEKSQKIAIYSGDSDMRQLVWSTPSDHPEDWAGCWTISTGFHKDVIYGPEEVEHKHGVKPTEIPFLKALSGDSSDNFPGVPGVGAVKAALLVNQYKNLGKLLRAAAKKDPDWPIGERLRKVVIKEAKNLVLYQNLATIREDCAWKRRRGEANQAALLEHLKRYRFLSLCHPNELGILMKLGKP